MQIVTRSLKLVGRDGGGLLVFSSVSPADRHEINQGHCKRWISSNQQHANGFLFLAFGFYQLLMCSKKKKKKGSVSRSDNTESLLQIQKTRKYSSRFYKR